MSKSKIIALSIVATGVIAISAWYLFGNTGQDPTVPVLRESDPRGSAWPSLFSAYSDTEQPAEQASTPTASNTVATTTPQENYIPKPDLTWGPETRMVNGKKVTYVFGEGQPVEVDGMFDHAANQPSVTYWSTPTTFNDGNNPYGYVTADFEKKLHALLSDERFHFLVNQCYHELGFDKQTDFFGGPVRSLNMRDFLVIDPETGRKEVNYRLFQRIGGALVGIDFPLAEHPSEQKWRECLTEEQHDAILVPVSSQLYGKAQESWTFVNR